MPADDLEGLVEEHIQEAEMSESDCCNAPMDEWYEEVLICPDCKEHCGIREEEDE